MSLIYFLGTTKPLAHTRYSFNDIIPDLDSGCMLCGDGIIFEDNLCPDAIATGVQKILTDCHIYAVQTALGLDYEARYKQIYSPQTAADMVKFLHWFKGFICSRIAKGSKVYLIKLWQGKSLPPKEVKRQKIQTDEWLITGDSDVIFEYGTLYEFSSFHAQP